MQRLVTFVYIVDTLRPHYCAYWVFTRIIIVYITEGFKNTHRYSEITKYIFSISLKEINYFFYFYLLFYFYFNCDKDLF